MRLSTRSRYGLLMMLELADHYKGGRLLLKEIARNQNISVNYLAQLASPLLKHGLIQSERRIGRGYELSVKPSSITVLRIVEILERDLSPEARAEEEPGVDDSSACPTRRVWTRMNEAIRQALSEFTLEDLLADFQACKSRPSMYHI